MWNVGGHKIKKRRHRSKLLADVGKVIKVYVFTKLIMGPANGLWGCEKKERNHSVAICYLSTRE